VVEKISKEVKLGRIAGPFKQRPISNLIISPAGLVPKAVPGKYRMIQHLSYPDGDPLMTVLTRIIVQFSIHNLILQLTVS
jgi:hypothetical protein